MSNKKTELPVVCCGRETDTCGADPYSNKPEDRDTIKHYWQIGDVITPGGMATRIATRLGWRDISGTWKARWGIGRLNYCIPPGLYAVGDPGPGSAVLVTANYKMSFDHLRRELAGLNLWLLIINTNGINVWCAAGKGTFGTEEIVRRIDKVKLHKFVSHRRIILPQLAAPGVAAHEVRRQSGFRVIYGPVRAADIPAFLAAGEKCKPEMRAVRFNLLDRLAPVGVEFTTLARPFVFLVLALLLLNLPALLRDNLPFQVGLLFIRTAADIIPFAGAILAGTLLVPALLPYIPGRAFAWKGWLLGIAWCASYVFLITPGGGPVETTSYFLILPAIAGFLAMNFTGSSTYTSLSGVVKEMGYALPAIIVSAVLGTCGLIASRLFIW